MVYLSTETQSSLCIHETGIWLQLFRDNSPRPEKERS